MENGVRERVGKKEGGKKKKVSIHGGGGGHGGQFHIPPLRMEHCKYSRHIPEIQKPKA